MPAISIEEAFEFALERHKAGFLSEAETLYTRILSIDVHHAEATHYLGVLAYQTGHLENAIALMRSAAHLKPDYIVYNNLGSALKDHGALAEAKAAFQAALRLNPECPSAHYNIGLVFLDEENPDAALEHFDQALRLLPDYFDAYIALAEVFKIRGQIDLALNAYREALRLQPENLRVRSSYMYALHFAVDVPDELFAQENRAWSSLARRHCPSPAPDQTPAPEPQRAPLSIGYISPYLREHVIGRNLAPLLRYHDRSSFRVVCYSDSDRCDDLTARMKESADLWRETRRLGDREFAEQIRLDRVDILLDLTQRLGGDRLSLFAAQAATVQVSFAGYPESTGLETIRFRISDKWLEQGGTPRSDGSVVKTCIHEQVYLIDSFWCYDACGMEIQVNELPARTHGRITFGSLNNFCKVNEPLLHLWARVLTAVDDSRLVILSHEGSHRRQTWNFLEARDVDPRRVEFVTPRSRKEYLELHHRLDIVLDTFPYNGHTTSLDALWMGVPVVSLCGERPVSRAGLSQLSNLGLPELVAFTEDQYVEIATNLANDIPRLQELRATLRQRMENSVLMNGPHFARQIEACYRAMWRQWCESQSSASQT